jgi:hypothetical protein
MAGKQALREFQTRLAERLQAARSQGVAASWLAVRAGDARLLVPLSHAAEIFPGPTCNACLMSSPGSWASPTCAAT